MLRKLYIVLFIVTVLALHALANDQGEVTVVTIDNPNKQLTITVPIMEKPDPTHVAEHTANPDAVESLAKIKVAEKIKDEKENALRNNPELEANIYSALDEQNGDNNGFDDEELEEFGDEEDYEEDDVLNKVNPNVDDKLRKSNLGETDETEESKKTPSKPSEKDEKDDDDEDQETIDEEELAENKSKKDGILQAAANAPPLVTGCKTQGQLAITYNEGPSDVTAQVLRQYAKADARATFFVNASWLYTQQYSMVVKNIYNAGHFIGMTYRVKETNPANYKEDEVRKDIIKMASTVESIIKISPKYVRLYATKEKDYKTEKILRELGFVIVGYNLDSQDYAKQDATGPNSIQEVYKKAFKNYKEQFDTKGAFISLNYDLPFTGSLVAVPNVINTANDEGYTLVRLDGCLDDTKPYKKTANSTEYVSDKFSFGQPEYHSGQKRELLDAVVLNEKPAGGSTERKTESMGVVQKASIKLCLSATVFALFF